MSVIVFCVFRKVFDMLMSTAVKDQTAQYFLLTPKLLPNLNYEVNYLNILEIQ